jgi:N-methylhydantoinase B
VTRGKSITGGCATGADPITTEVLRNAFIAIAEDMNASLIRSAYSPIIYHIRDTAVALIDASRQVLAHSPGVPFFLGTLEDCVRLTEELLGEDIWEPGDVWVLNDAYLTGGHLNDLTVYSPIFFAGELAGFTASRAHHLDVGGKEPGGPATDSTDVYQEGLRLGPVKLLEGGRRRRDIFDILQRNSRLPHQLTGDVTAQIVASQVGERRFRSLLERYGRAAVEAARDDIFRQAEELDRAAVAAIPDGEYRAEGAIDSDGVSDAAHTVRVRVTIDGERMVVDLTETDDQAPGPVNAGDLMTISAVRCAFKRIINADLPVNGGAFRPLEIRVRPGSLLAAIEPAPTGYFYSALGLLVDLIPKALAPAVPELCAAAHYGDSSTIGLSGTDPRSGDPFVEHLLHVGGWGAWQGSDGESAMCPASITQVKDMSIEVLETKCPLRVSRYAIRPDSAGEGRWRGGHGTIREYVVDADDMAVTVWFERARTPGWGLFGGRDGSPPRVTLNPGTDGERRFLKVTALALARGDVLLAMTGGGGGYGDPADRDPDGVRRDVADGLLSPDRARDLYGDAIEAVPA